MFYNGDKHNLEADKTSAEDEVKTWLLVKHASHISLFLTVHYEMINYIRILYTFEAEKKKKKKQVDL